MGGEIENIDKDGYFFQPTLIEDMNQTMELYYHQSVQLPIVCLHEFDKLEEVFQEYQNSHFNDLILISEEKKVAKKCRENVKNALLIFLDQLQEHFFEQRKLCLHNRPRGDDPFLHKKS